MPVNWFYGSTEQLVLGLAERIASRSAVLLIGAGASALPPSNLPLGKALRDAIVREAFASSSLANCAQELPDSPDFQGLVPGLVFSDLYSGFRTKLFDGFEVLRNAVPNLLHHVIQARLKQAAQLEKPSITLRDNERPLIPGH